MKCRLLEVTGILAALLVLGCNPDSAEQDRASPAEPELAASTVPLTIGVTSGKTKLLVGECSDGWSANTTGFDTHPYIDWSSSNYRVASVHPRGFYDNFAIVCGLSDGFASISAFADGGMDGNVSSQGVLVDVGQPVRSVSIQPSTVSVKVGATAQLSSVAVDPYGVRVARAATWTSANPAIATVSATGLVTGKGLGKTTISARINGITGTVPVTVGVANLYISGPGQITAQGRYTFTAVVSPTGTYTYNWHLIMYGNGITQTFTINPLTLSVQASTGSLSLRVTVSQNGVALGTATKVVQNSIPGSCGGRRCP